MSYTSAELIMHVLLGGIQLQRYDGLAGLIERYVLILIIVRVTYVTANNELTY